MTGKNSISEPEALGIELKQAREERGLTPIQVEKEIKIRAKFIEAMDTGNFDLLPSISHARGFLRNYARFLGLDGELAVSRYDEMMFGGRKRRRRNDPPPPSLSSTQQMRAVNQDTTGSFKPVKVPTVIYTVTDENLRRGQRAGRVALLLGVLTLAVIGIGLFIGLGGLSLFTGQNQSQIVLNPAATSIPPTQAPTDTPTVLRPTPLPNAQPTLAAASNGNPNSVSIQLQITARTWIRVIVDGDVRYIGSPAPNTILQYQGQSIQVRAANGIGVRAVVNNLDLGLMGARGEIVDRTFTANSISVAPAPSSAIPDAATISPIDPTLGSNGSEFTPTEQSGSTSATGTPLVQANAPNTVLTRPSVTLVKASPTLIVPTATPLPTDTPTKTFTATIQSSPTGLYLPNVTNTPLGGEIRPKATAN